MPNRASIYLNVALVAAALGFGLIAGPVAVIAKVVGVIFAGRFVLSLLAEVTPTIWTRNRF